MYTDELLREFAWVQALARRLVADENDADDLAQDAFLTVLETRPRGIRRARSWLGTVLRNRAASAGRSKSRRRRREESRPASTSELPPDEVLERAELHRTLVDRVMKLSEPYRTTLLLRYFDELSPAEIADRTKSSAATVRSRLHRALALLRDQFDREHGRTAWIPGIAALATRGVPLGSATAANEVAAAATRSVPMVTSAAPSSTATSVSSILWTVGGVIMASKSVSVPLVTAAVLVAGLSIALWPTTPPQQDASSASRETVQNANDPERPAPIVSTPVTTPLAVDIEIAVDEPETPRGILRGVVRDVLGSPLEDVSIAIDNGRIAMLPSHNSRPEDRENLPDPATTDVDGRFAFKLAPGLYDLVASSHGFRVLTHPGVEVAAESERELEFILKRGLVVAGIVVDEAGHGIAGARIETAPLQHYSDGSVTMAVGTRPDDFLGARTATTAPDGRFSLAGLGSGNYRLIVRHDDHAAAEESNVAAGSDGLRIVLGGAGAIRGRLVDDDGESLADVWIAIATGGTRLEKGTTSGADGRFHLRGLIPGTYRLKANARGRLPAETTDLEVVRDGETNAGDLVLGRGAAIVGRVLFENGQPVSDARVHPIDAKDDRWLASEVRTGEDGRFQITALTPNPCRIVITHNGDTTRTDVLVPSVDGTDAGDIKIRVGTTLSGTVRDAGGRTLLGAGVVLREKRMTEAKDGSVARSQSGTPRQSRTGHGGHFAISGLTPGSVHTLEIYREGYASHREDVALNDATDTEIAITLAHGTVIGGHVVDDLGRPVPGAEVTIEVQGNERGGNAIAKTRTGASGDFVVRGFDEADERFFVLVTATGFSQWKRKHLSATTDELDQIVLVRDGRLEGLVREAASKEAVATFQVRLHSETTSSRALNRAIPGGIADVRASSGRFVLHEVPAGIYTVEIRAPGYATTREDGVVVTSGETSDVTITLTRGSSLRGRIVDAKGTPVAGARIVSRKDDDARSAPQLVTVSSVLGQDDDRRVYHRRIDMGGNEVGVETAADGTFTIEGLPIDSHGGGHDLIVRHRDFLRLNIPAVKLTEATEHALGDLRLRRGARVHGRVVTSDGRPQRWGTIEFESESIPRTRLIQLEGNHEFSISGLPSGDYTLNVVGEKGTFPAVTLDANDDEEVELRLAESPSDAP